MSIGELAARAGIPASAIRYYESVGLIPKPGRVGGRRVYAPAAVQRLQVIQSARALGFGVREIRTLIDDTTSITDRWRTMARRKLPELETLIGRAMNMKKLLESGLRCSCVTIEDCIVHNCAPPPLVSPALLIHPASRGAAKERNVALLPRCRDSSALTGTQPVTDQIDRKGDPFWSQAASIDRKFHKN